MNAPSLEMRSGSASAAPSPTAPTSPTRRQGTTATSPTMSRPQRSAPMQGLLGAALRPRSSLSCRPRQDHGLCYLNPQISVGILGPNV